MVCVCVYIYIYIMNAVDTFGNHRMDDGNTIAYKNLKRISIISCALYNAQVL